MSFKEIKELNEIFILLKAYNDFYEYLQLLSKDKKIKIKKCKDKVSIILFIDALYKQQEIKIDLFPEKKDFESKIIKKNKEFDDLKSKFEIKIHEKNKEIENLNRQIKKYLKDNEDLIEQNNKLNIKLEIINEEIKKEKNSEENMKIEDLKKQIKEYNKEKEDLKEQIKKLNDKLDVEKINLNASFTFNKCLLYSIVFILIIYSIFYINLSIQKFFAFDKSLIMSKYEKQMIFSEIEMKNNKKIKGLKKLYQATIDGGDSINFHLKCDYIPNTLVLIKSEGNRRFGGFTPIPWKSEDEYKLKLDLEEKTFVFSLDNKKIYNLKSRNEYAVYHKKDSGPCFGGSRDIGIDRNPLIENSLLTKQSESFDYKGNSNALSEYNGQNKLKILEYEVFQIIFD